ncbi:hypothetical protein FHP25_04710 [Vineibacter terrae]|uniref:Uncharacterized protein n=1 Tax=Vineibacter terrae TaxID=2586908 RepID=A0A5C8PU20_9HYPH|nr:hypothetical protein [Vineibacter terrae]TXL80338.1 hypothetical protein FHP25_04710 [Vineibacter terrae]
MSAGTLSPTMRQFVDFLGELGPRWGLQADPCRVHAYLYLVGRPARQADIAAALGLDVDAVAAALAYLTRWRMASPADPDQWQVGGDPWEMLMSGLDERRRDEIAPALATLRACHAGALRDHAGSPSIARRIGAVLDLAEDLAAIDAQARRLSPQVLRRMVGLSGRAARFMDRAFGPRRGDRS